jgi:hypothetical protein
MSVYLKVKAKSLAAEARIIRREERKRSAFVRYAQRTNHSNPAKARGEQVRLHLHRVGVVRSAARETHIARGFISGKPYSQIEKPTRNPLSQWQVSQVCKTINRYGPQTSIEDLKAWIDA